MGILDRFGLGRKAGHRPRRAGLQIPKKKPRQGRPLTRDEILLRVGIFGALLVMTILMFPTREPYDQISQVQPGDVWQRQEVIAPFKFPIFKSEAQLEAERDSIRFDEPPVFAREAQAVPRTEAAIDSLEGRLDALFSAYVGWRQGREQGDGQAAAADSARYFERLDGFETALTGSQLEKLIASRAARAGLATATREGESGPPLDVLLLRTVRTIANRVLPYGVLDVPKDSVLTSQITVVNPDERTEVLVPKQDVYGYNDAVTAARNELNVRFPNRPDTVAIGVTFFDEVLVPSLRYLEGESEARWAEKEERISRTSGMVREGESLIRRGDRVTPEIQRQLYSLSRLRAEQQGDIGPYRIMLGELVLCAAAFLIFFLYLFLMRRQVYNETRYLLLVALLFGAIVGFFGVAVRLSGLAELAVPVGLASILLTVIFDSRVGMFGTVTLACIGGLIFGYDFQFTFATIFAGTLAVFSVRDVKNRSQIILTAGLVFGAYVLILGSYTLLSVGQAERFLSELFLVGINSVLLLLAYPLLWIFERTFGVTTDLTLLELSDTNRPLLKELSLRAPGTFNHSLQVANLAEAAADAVGANALQARIGALYHDIGKMLKPEYYIENQQPGDNPHDRVTPYMSALIIASHVKDGLELGREYNLPEVVLNFIPTHHGTTLMEYFFRKAKELRGPEDPTVDEMEFRYPGPRPQTNEQGIVMLADSVEAASRSLDKPTPRRLEGLVDSIFRARIEEGQLDGCALTFADLNLIKETFLSILGGIYHFRVKYPDQDKATGEGPPPEAVPEAPPPVDHSAPAEAPPPAQDVAPPAPSEADGGGASSSASDAPALPRPSLGYGEKPGPSSEERASLG
jgi:cyclic-di-AMP phosphodiesterase PgpH